MSASLKPLVSVIVVAASDAARLERCLAAVVSEAGDVAVEIVVVLNAAEPGLGAAVRRAAPAAVVVESEVALGFAGGLNLAARHASGDLLHLLHDDTEVGAGWLAPLIAALEDHPRAGAAGPLVLGADGLVQSAGHVLWNDGNTHPPWFGIPPDPRELRTVAVHDFCTSAALLVRRAAWDAVGGMDEEIHPAQYVDADFAMALHSRGYVIVCAPTSQVRHARGGTGSYPRKVFAAVRNRERFAAKWAADLVHQAPCEESPQAVQRAREATARRAQAILAMPEPPGDPRPRASAGPGAESPLERLRRERGALLRDVEFNVAYAAHLESAVAGAEAALSHERARALAAETASRAALERERALTAQLAELRLAADERDAAAATRVAELEAAGAARVAGVAAAAATRIAELEAATAALGAELAHRGQMLDAITAGGWWRLRGRLRPVLRLAAGIRRAVPRRSA